MEQQICQVKKFLIETEKEQEFYIQQIPTSCLSQNAYYIESNGKSAIIDPMRDIDYYINLLKTRNSNLEYIFETHFHADFVSGHFDLSKKTGAKIIFGPNVNIPHEIISAEDNQVFELGNIKLKIIHTPGHTLESISILLIHKETEKALFSGDTIFLGDVGRPDLAVNDNQNLSVKDLANYLYDSIQKIKNLDENLIIFPGHGAGSACGKNISAGIGDTLKNQKLNNYALSNELAREDFLNIVTSNLNKPLNYFFHDVKLNKEGYESIDILLQKTVKPLKYEDFIKLSSSLDLNNNYQTYVIDTRSGEDFTKGFFKGSYGISLKMTYAIWVATLLKPEDQIILITDPGKENESIIRLFRVGYYNILGYLEGGFENFLQKNTDVEYLCKIPRLDYADSLKMFEDKKIELIDVREIKEFENDGIVENSHLMPLRELENNINEIKEYKNGIGLYCKSGARAVIAGSILKKYGIENIFICGGYDTIKNKGFKCIKYQ
jgi:glyoxylase-like metal-dependent hydrolase (beta-lactamase superfamily II)/rhodanese-related sulfurtransferase